MNRSFLRSTAWALVLFLTAAPLAPVVRAQSAPAVDMNALQDTLAQKEGLEDIYTRQATRQVQMQAELQALNQMTPPKGVDVNAWNAKRAQDTQTLGAQIQQNNSLMQRTQQKLAPIYGRVQDAVDKAKAANDPNLQMQIGTLAGVAGLKVVPIYGKPPPAGSPPGTPNMPGRLTAADISGMAKYGMEQAHLRTVNWRIPVYQNVATNAGSRADNATNALGSQASIEWKPEPNPETGNMRLVAHDAALGTPIEGKPPIETPVPAKYNNTQGQPVDNPTAVQDANDFAQLYNTRSQIGEQLTATQLKASRAINSAQRDFFQKHADELTAKKAQLESDINQYQQTKPSIGERMAGLGKDAGKWALMSVGVAATTNVVTQLAHNGWNPAKVNYGQAVSFLGDKHFWGGTIGSFGGSMLGSVIASAIPGGVFAKTALSIGGAALGWQFGSGNLANTDFIGLGVTTLGSTAGYMLGMAVGGPIGAFLGGIAGQFVSQYIYDAVKDMLIKEQPSSSAGATTAALPVDPTQTGAPPGPPGLNPGQVNPAQTGDPGGAGVGPGGGIPNPGTPPVTASQPTDGSVPGSPGSIEDAEKRMSDAYNAAQAATAAGDQQLATLKMQEYQEIRTWIQMKRRATTEAGGDFHREQN